MGNNGNGMTEVKERKQERKEEFGILEGGGNGTHEDVCHMEEWQLISNAKSN